jgi:hypothetical protein
MAFSGALVCTRPPACSWLGKTATFVALLTRTAEDLPGAVK